MILTFQTPQAREYELHIKNIETGTTSKILSFESQVTWLFFDKANNTFLVIEGVYQQVPLTIHLYSMNGEELRQKNLTDKIFQDALMFDWIRLK